MKQRPSARILIIDRDNRLLLFNFKFNDGALAGLDFWATPGGGLKNGETYKQAAQRELFEETGMINSVGEEIAQRDATFKTPNGDTVFADERYFLARPMTITIKNDGYSVMERHHMVGFKWWPINELQNTTEQIYPENLISMLKSLS